MTINILTLNLWNINEPIIERLDEIINFIKIQKPDVIALQEVSRLEFGILQSEYIANKVKYVSHYYVNTGFWEGREEGIAILSSHDFLLTKKLLLPNIINDMKRQLAYCKIKIGNININFYNTHLAYHIKETEIRKQQILCILDFIKSNNSNGYNIICGDFNDTPNSNSIKTLFKNKIFYDAWNTLNPKKEGITFSQKNKYVSPNLWPERRIDYIGVSYNIEVTHCSLVFTENSKEGIVSDHYGIYAKVRI